MKLWFVVYLFGELFAVSDPLPGDYAQCMAARAVAVSKYQVDVGRGTVPPNSLQFVCKFSVVRPGIFEGKPI